MLDRKAKVKSIKNLGARNYLLTLSSPEQARLVRPGQFVMLKCVEGLDDNPLLRRPFTIFNVHRHARSRKPGGLELLVKDVGSGTHKLVGTRPGQMLHCLGPQGRCFQVTSAMRNRVCWHKTSGRSFFMAERASKIWYCVIILSDWILRPVTPLKTDLTASAG
jgi:NAD(P)H-flavin reductase